MKKNLNFLFKVQLINHVQLRLVPYKVYSAKEHTSKEDSLRSVLKSSQTWRNAISLRPCYRPSRIVMSFYTGKEAAS
jgi:hypothetical protein